MVTSFPVYLTPKEDGESSDLPGMGTPHFLERSPQKDPGTLPGSG